jgi:hypothetical protein
MPNKENEVVFDKCWQKALLQVLYREHIGFGSRLNCSGVRSKGNWCWRHVARWRKWLCISSCSLNSPLFQELSFELVVFCNLSPVVVVVIL